MRFVAPADAGSVPLRWHADAPLQSDQSRIDTKTSIAELDRDADVPLSIDAARMLSDENRAASLNRIRAATTVRVIVRTRVGAFADGRHPAEFHSGGPN